MTFSNSEYFSLTQLADGIYAAIGKINSPVFSNAGIIDTGDHILIFDTFNSHHAAQDLRRMAKNLTGRTGDFVIISHAHGDHWKGNQVYAENANIITTPEISQAMSDWIENYKEIKRNPGEYREYLQNTGNLLSDVQDPRLQAHIEWVLVIQQYEFENLRAIRPTLPNQTFENQITFHGSKRIVEIYTPGAGHTESDIILKSASDSVAFIGDLGFFKTHPYLGSSTPEKWMQTLDDLIVSEIDTFVPGHGPVGSKEDLQLLKAYILACEKLVAETIKNEDSERDAIRKGPPEFSDSWAGFGRFERTIRFLYQREIERLRKG